ncbi:MAG: ferrous iron transporter B [Bryobacteraceae bacterium]|nr:ferrous iron transporter B [Bryobacteraceae bacterium]
MSGCDACPSNPLRTGKIASSSRRRTVAIVGPPNSGKSTLFNALTGLRQKVANFPGVTVEHRIGRAHFDGDQEVDLIDLPGVYSLSPISEDEQVTHDVLTGAMAGIGRPDAILLVIDSTNLARQLTLAAPVLSLGIPTMVLLNLADELRRRGGVVNTEALAQQIGAPVALVSAARGEGLEAVHEFLSGSLAVPRPLELPVVQDLPCCREWAGRMGERASYRAPAPPLWTRRLDGLFLHPLGGPLTLAAMMVLVFQAIFSWAQPLIGAVQWVIESSGNWLGAALPDTALRSLLLEGVWGGVGTVLTFLPQILILFLFITILEDSGYMSRAALIADRTMAKVGLQGKSFIPLLSAHACAVPAILATRTIENRRDRIATILIMPFMTCSARLPVYTLVIAAFLPERPLIGPFLGTRAAALMGLYLLGYLAAFTTARLLKSSVLKSEPTPFVLELPPYRLPTFKTVLLTLWDRARVFLYRAGTIILLATLVLWGLAHLPLQDGKAPPLEQSVAGTLGRTIEPLIEPLGFNWKIGVGLISSLAAREVIVSTLGTLYGIEGDPESEGLQSALQRDLSLGGAVALLVFFAFAMQCMSTVATVRRETGGWRWPLYQFVYMSALAYFGALAANHLVRLVVG